jgi:hypothetical protein
MLIRGRSRRRSATGPRWQSWESSPPCPKICRGEECSWIPCGEEEPGFTYEHIDNMVVCQDKAHDRQPRRRRPKIRHQTWRVSRPFSPAGRDSPPAARGVFPAGRGASPVGRWAYPPGTYTKSVEKRLLRGQKLPPSIFSLHFSPLLLCCCYQE